ncbi:MAG: DUF2145 domain-containing protein, partial [Brachymonas sp.]
MKMICAALLAAITINAQAGRSCDAPKPPSPQMITQGMNLAEKTWRALEAEHAKSGAKVVVLARAGQDLSKYGLRYSHLGFAYKATDGRWLVAHKLNTCGTAEASLYRQGFGEFFLDDLFRFEAAWAIPTKEVQEKLHAALLNESRTKAMHIKPYSMVSYVWGTKYQQSNQWAIETLAAAMESSIRNRDQAQAWLQFKGYQPTTLNIPPLTRLGGRNTQANVEFDDHPAKKRFSDRIESVTVDSVFTWLPR